MNARARIDTARECSVVDTDAPTTFRRLLTSLQLGSLKLPPLARHLLPAAVPRIPYTSPVDTSATPSSGAVLPSGAHVQLARVLSCVAEAEESEWDNYFHEAKYTTSQLPLESAVTDAYRSSTAALPSVEVDTSVSGLISPPEDSLASTLRLRYGPSRPQSREFSPRKRLGTQRLSTRVVSITPVPVTPPHTITPSATLTHTLPPSASLTSRRQTPRKPVHPPDSSESSAGTPAGAAPLPKPQLCQVGGGLPSARAAAAMQVYAQKMQRAAELIAVEAGVLRSRK